jgi:hypothetical protein
LGKTVFFFGEINPVFLGVVPESEVLPVGLVFDADHELTVETTQLRLPLVTSSEHI